MPQLLRQTRQAVLDIVVDLAISRRSRNLLEYRWITDALPAFDLDFLEPSSFGLRIGIVVDGSFADFGTGVVGVLAWTVCLS